jgi:hypothetical protein
MSTDTLEYINTDTKAGILVQLGHVVNNCAEFVTKYSARKNVGALVLVFLQPSSH